MAKERRATGEEFGGLLGAYDASLERAYFAKSLTVRASADDQIRLSIVPSHAQAKAREFLLATLRGQNSRLEAQWNLGRQVAIEGLDPRTLLERDLLRLVVTYGAVNTTALRLALSSNGGQMSEARERQFQQACRTVKGFVQSAASCRGQQT